MILKCQTYKVFQQIHNVRYFIYKYDFCVLEKLRNKQIAFSHILFVLFQYKKLYPIILFCLLSKCGTNEKQFFSPIEGSV